LLFAQTIVFLLLEAVLEGEGEFVELVFQLQVAGGCLFELLLENF
jgi:hypothetical protein